MTMSADNLHPTDLLPWYANGSLAQADMKQVANHLAQCDQCIRELRFLQGLHEQVRQVEAVHAPGEFGLRRLQRDIRLGDTVRSSNKARRWQWLAAAAMLVILVQAGVIFNLQQQQTDLYTPSGASHGEGVVLQVQFTQQVSAARIQQVLQSVDASIISGPSAIGLYRLSLNVAPQNAEQIQQIIDTLKQQKDVLAYVAQE
jgi:hypothetical protein